MKQDKVNMAGQHHGMNFQTEADARRRTIMIVDDHPLVCKGLEGLINQERDLQVASVAGNTSDTMAALRHACPDMLLLDLSLPGIGGLEFLKDVKVQYPELRVLVLSMHEENVYAERVLRAGAQGYIMKQEPGEKVVEAIRCVLSGNIYASQSLQTQLLQKIATNGEALQGKAGPETLADRELQVYTLIGEGHTAREIAARLNLSPKTIQTYREHIKTKLGLRSAMELTRSAVLWYKSGR
jgi:DNA-binding NarL/FixJ family response regulator